jgi:MarR family 2-MHQ and catechol resistance regulon transcriptional repressor
MGTRYDGTVEQLRALNAFIALRRAANSVTQALHAPLTRRGLSEPQFATLEALLHLGPLRPSELAAKLLCTPGNMTPVLDHLARRGLLTRRREPDDRRCVRVVLTARGRALIQRLFPAHAARVAATFAVLDAREQIALRELCRKLGLSAGRKPVRGDAFPATGPSQRRI